MITGATLFDAAIAARCPQLSFRKEGPEDAEFLRALFVACSPLAEHLPAAMLTQQADLQDRGFRTARPLAMRRIAVRAGEPVGRIMIDWDGAGSYHGVDIAVLPGARASGLALAMLRAWLAAADQLGRVCTLEVLATNPAQVIYRRLGFRPLAEGDANQPVIEMYRPVGG